MSRKSSPKSNAILRALTLSVWLALNASAASSDSLTALAGRDGIVYAVDKDDRVLADLNSHREFLPASTLKLFTTLLALNELGDDWRFHTQLFVDGDRLIVKGLGDPFLVSEELDSMAEAAAPQLKRRRFGGIGVDNSFFDAGLAIPGVGRSDNPYDARNAATAVNFNTIAVARRGGKIVSTEPQTPLTPTAESVARRRGVRGSSRIPLGDDSDEVARYAGELIAAKLRARGLDIGPKVTRARAASAAPLLDYRNQRSLADVCRDMLAVSNNFVANQLFLTIGARVFGAPATLDKSVRAAERFLASHPRLSGLRVVEGSGIAYENSTTAAAMVELLRLLESRRDLLSSDHGTRHKTGTLKAIATVAGYLETARHGLVRYVVALPGARREQRWEVVDWLRRNLD